MTVRVDSVVTEGALAVDSEDHSVENNVWLVGDDEEVVIIDAGHDAEAILAATGDREILAVICTHGRADHVNAAGDVADRDEAPIAVPRGDRMLWDSTYPEREPDIETEDGGVFEVAGQRLEVLHTPGHTPGGISLYAPELEVVFTGDTLAKGGPGQVPSTPPDLTTLLTSIGERLLTLPGETRVLPARGEETTVEAEDEHFDELISSAGSAE